MRRLLVLLCLCALACTKAETPKEDAPGYPIDLVGTKWVRWYNPNVGCNVIEFVAPDSLIKYNGDGWMRPRGTIRGQRFERDGEHLWITESPIAVHYYIFTSPDTLYQALNYSEIFKDHYFVKVTEP